MAIQMRRGANPDFDVNKMLPGEIAVTTDGTRKVYATFKAGDAKELASKEDIQYLVDKTQEANKSAQAAANTAASNANTAIAEANNASEKAKEASDAAKEAQELYNKTEAVSGIHIASNEIAGVIKPGDNMVEEDGTFRQLKTVQGSSLVLDNSYKGALKINKTFGRSEQRKTTGAQLFGLNETIQDGGLTFTFENGKCVANGTLSNTWGNLKEYNGLPFGLVEGKTYTLKADGEIKYGLWFYDTNKNNIGVLSDSSGAFTIPTGVASSRLYFEFVVSGKTYTNSETKIMLNAGSEPLPWEPYTGGQSAPNPQYRQPIVNAGQRLVDGWQLANLPDVEEAEVNGITWSCKNGAVTAKGASTAVSPSNGNAGISSPIPIVAGTYYISGDVGDLRAYVVIKASDGTMSYIHERSFTLDGTEQEATVYCQVANGVTIDTTIYPMLNVGTTAKPWEPYTAGGYTDGSQLFDKTKVLEGYVSTTEIITDSHSDYYRSDYIPVNGSNIIISGHNMGYAGGTVGMLGFDSNKNIVANSNSATLDISACSYVMISVPRADINRIMLNYGTVPKAWQPYTAGMKPVIDVPIETEVLGKNLLSYPYLTTQTKNGVTFTVNSDGTIIASGTATEDAILTLNTITLDNNNYILSGCPGGGTNTSYRMDCYYSGHSTQDIGNGIVFKGLADKALVVRIIIGDGVTASNLIFKPMIRLADCEDSTYEPYKLPQPLLINKPGGFPGIEVTDASLANYIDADGKMWCCDTREWDRGVDVKRISVRTLVGIESWEIQNDKYFIVGYRDAFNLVMSESTASTYLKSTIGSVGYATLDNGGYGLAYAYGIRIRLENMNPENNTIDELKAYLAENPITVMYPLATPIETHIPEEEAEAWRALYSNHPTTTVLSDADVEVEYPASRVGAVAMDAERLSRENALKIEDVQEKLNSSVNDDISVLTSGGAVDIGMDGTTTVMATLCMVKLSHERANITINYKLTHNALAGNTSIGGSVNWFIDINRLKSALGVTNLSFSFEQTAVTLHRNITLSDNTRTVVESYLSEAERGSTGLMFAEDGCFCRDINGDGGYKSLPICSDCYIPGTYGTITINGAYIGDRGEL